MKRFALVPAAVMIAAVVAVQAQQAPPAGAPQTAPPAAQQQRPPQAPLGPTEWRIDRSHSAANFSVRHNVVSTVRGQLGPISGKVEWDGKDVRTVSADVAVDMNGINTQNEGRDKHLRSADFFDVANHPALTFKSKRVEPAADGRFRLVGDLTIKGVTKPAVWEVVAQPRDGGLQGTATTSFTSTIYTPRFCG